MKFGKLFKNRYIKYNIRWQSGFVVCYPCMWLFQDYLGWSTFWSVIAFQVVGANIFYHVDGWIFRDKTNKLDKNQTV